MKRNAFTLVELLIVVLIITILATITLFALFNAGEAAKKARTQAQIAKIHDLIMPVWESYSTRRVPISIAANIAPGVAAGMRVDGLRELMRMELPDRKSDVEDTPATLTAPPSLWRAYDRKVAAAGGYGNWSLTHQQAECLYLILSRMQDGESNGLEHFRADEIGDKDGDGMPEILDGWGTPIRWLRWAPGYIGAYSSLHNATAADPLDPMGVRGVPPDTFALYPLVISAGADTAFDVMFDDSSGAIHYKTTSPPNNPYELFGGNAIGTIVDNDGPGGVSDGVQSHGDNLTNHLGL